MLTNMASSWENIVASRIYPKLDETTDEADGGEIRDALKWCIGGVVFGKASNLYDDKDKDESNHGMWVPRLEPTLPYEATDPNADEDEEGME